MSEKKEWGFLDFLWNEIGGDNLKTSVSWKGTHNTTTMYVFVTQQWLDNKSVQSLRACNNHQASAGLCFRLGSWTKKTLWAFHYYKNSQMHREYPLITAVEKTLVCLPTTSTNIPLVKSVKWASIKSGRQRNMLLPQQKMLQSSRAIWIDKGRSRWNEIQLGVL